VRHLRSILYALVLAPAVWTLCGVGFTRDLTGRARTEQSIEQWSGLLLLVLAGAAYAILLLPRLSPAGPGLAGSAFLGVSVWVLVDPGSFEGLWPHNVTKDGFDLILPAYGLAALLAVPLLCTTLSARRWRREDWAPPSTNHFVWPFARPAHVGTLVVAGNQEMPSDATQVLPNPGRSEAQQIVDATQVVSAGNAAAGGAAASGAAASGAAAGDRTQVISAPPVPAPVSPAPVSPAPVAPAVGRPSSAIQAAELPEDATQVVIPAPKAAPAPAPASAPTFGASEPGEEMTQIVIPARTPAAPASPAAEEVTESMGEVTEQVDVGDRTQVIGATGPGEKTQLIGGPGEKTQLIGGPGEQTQVIGGAPVDPGEKTQVITGPRTGAGTVEPPGDRTQVISIPTGPGEKSTVRREPAPKPQLTDDTTTAISASTDDTTTVISASADDTTTVISAPAEEPTAAVERVEDEQTAVVGSTDEPDTAPIAEPTVDTTVEPSTDTVPIQRKPRKKVTKPQG
jgi:hypothetical protein